MIVSGKSCIPSPPMLRLWQMLRGSEYIINGQCANYGYYASCDDPHHITFDHIGTESIHAWAAMVLSTKNDDLVVYNDNRLIVGICDFDMETMEAVTGVKPTVYSFAMLNNLFFHTVLYRRTLGGRVAELIDKGHTQVERRVESLSSEFVK